MKYIGDYTSEISFPLGGIGTGCVGLGGNGRLMDWEIFNRPSKGSINGYSHFAIKAVKDNKPITFVLNGDLEKDFMGQYKQSKFTGYGFGPDSQMMCGFPHFKNVEFDGEFPIATLNFKDDKFPADVTMTAFNPFIPNDSKNSSIPAAFFEIEVTDIDQIEECYNDKTAVICSTDYYAFQVYFKAKNAKIVGFDNLDAIIQYKLNIDSVGYSVSEIARSAIDIIVGKKSGNFTVAYKIIEHKA